MNINDLLTAILRLPGEGLPVVSTGSQLAAQIQNKLYHEILGHNLQEQGQIQKVWRQSWFELNRAKVVLIGVPSDTGAGIRRGAAKGPTGVRKELYEMVEFQNLLRSKSIIDLGDVLVNPHLLHDEMLSDHQIQQCQNEMYRELPQTIRGKLPVSPLSNLELVLAALVKDYPHLKIFLLGGDHSVAWPMAKVMAQKYGKYLGIVQPDAHTDLLPSRFGVKYCFGTWSYHANELLDRNRLFQVGIRQSGRTKEHWESTLGVKQYWAEEVLAHSDQEMVQRIIADMRSRNVKQVYFSNDIDGTDESFAAATGTPAAKGLTPQFLNLLIDTIAHEFQLVAADVNEVAPDLGPTIEDSQKTCTLAAQYALKCIQGMLKE